MSATDTDQSNDYLQIDIVSDVVCPWCIVGFKQLEKAIHETATPATVKWHPFELNPQMPEEGQNLREHITEKYGTSAEESVKARDRLTAIGAELGFTFNFTDNMRMVNTFKAHQLLHWAVPYGQEHPLKMAMFEAYFGRQKNLNDPEILASIAESVGLDGAEARDVLADERFAEAVRDEEAFFTNQGIQGVPAVIFDRKHLVTGAQGAENYAAILNQLKADVAE